LRTELFGAYLLEEPGVEVPGIVDEHVDTAEALDGGLDGGLGVRATGDVELDDEQTVRFADGLGHGVRVAARCDNGIAGGKRRLGDVDRHASPGAGNYSKLLRGH